MLHEKFQHEDSLSSTASQRSGFESPFSPEFFRPFSSLLRIDKRVCHVICFSLSVTRQRYLLIQDLITIVLRGSYRGILVMRDKLI